MPASESIFSADTEGGTPTAYAVPSGASREEILAHLPAIVAEIAQGAAERERRRELPFPIFERLRQTGLTWLRIPKSLGGPGGSLSDQIEVTCALASADSSVAHALRSHFGFLESIALAPESKAARRYAPLILRGALMGGAHMEINTPRPNMLRTRLTRKGDRYRLSGHKYYATGAAYADYTSFTALNDEGKIASVLVPAHREGVNILDDWDGMGQRMSASGSVELADVDVAPEEIGAHGFFEHGDSTAGFIQRHGATRAQLHLMAVVCGIVRNIQRDAIDYVTKRARSAKHSASETARGDHFVQSIVGEIAALSHAVDVLVASTARSLDVSAQAILDRAVNLDDIVLKSQIENSKTQIVVGRLAIQAAEKIFDTGGGSATSQKNNFDRHWRNIRTLLNHNPAFLRGRVLGDYYLNGVRDDFDEGRVF
ncbi:MAG: acyl-CoA dehydrogenase family protein [Acetobacter sp.]